MPKQAKAAGAAASVSQAADPAKSITRWLDEIDLYEKDAKPWMDRGDEIVKRYLDKRDNPRDERRRYNVLYAITETTRPALYARNPKPDIQRRFKDADPIGRVASDVLERSCSYFVDTDKFGSIMRSTVMDYILPGRGTVWIRYVPHMRPVEKLGAKPEAAEPAEGVEVTDDVENPPEVISYEEVAADYVHWKDAGHNICRTWDEVWLVWRKVYLDREELEKRFGEELGKTIPLDYVQKDSKGGKVEGAQGSKATIYECWDKIKRCAVWLHKDVRNYLDKREDPLKLQEFFPCPKFMFANLANDSLIPTPFFVEYQDQANELDDLTARISSITKSLKVAGCYDSSAEGLGRLLSEGVQNKLIPVDSWAAFADKGGIKGAISFLPLEEIVNALESLYASRDKVEQVLYNITGIADIIRGVSDPSETMGAQQIKSNFATLRIGDHQRSVQIFAREIIRLMVEVIAGHFQIETIAEISGVRLLTKKQKDAYSAAVAQAKQAQAAAAQQGGQPQAVPPMPPLPPNVTPDQFEQMMTDPTWEEVAALIKNDALRCFRIDIETDSTIKQDEQQDKADRVEFLKAASGFLSQAMEAGEKQPLMAPLLMQMLMFGIRGFPIGKELEGAFNTTLQKLEKQAANPQPKPNPEMAKVEGQLQLAREKAANDIKVAQAEQAAQSQQDQAEQAREAQREQAKLASEERINLAKIRMEGVLAIRKAHIDAASRIEVARITAGIDDGQSAYLREAAGEAESAVTGMDLTPGMVSGQPGQSSAPTRDGEMHGKMDLLINHLANEAQKPPPPDLTPAMTALLQGQGEHTQAIMGLHGAVTAEKEIVRDKGGKATGLRIKKGPATQAEAMGARLNA